jgi:parallel beta-helix repeat protein
VSSLPGQAVRASTSVGGVIDHDTVWQGEILVTEHVTVQSGVTLTIEPGSRVKFHHYRGYRDPGGRLSMQVHGQIIAEGTAADPIYFTSDAPDPQNGDWSMVRLVSPSAQSIFHYCVFEFGQQGLNVWQGSPDIAHVVFRWNNWEGVYFESFSQPTIDYCQIYENGYNGLAAEQSNDILMDHCEVSFNGTNGVHIDNSTAEVRRTLVHDNHANGVSVDDGGTLRVLGDEVYDNWACGVGIGEGSNIVQVDNSSYIHDNGVPEPNCPAYTIVNSPYSPPSVIYIGFQADMSYALGYIPGDPALDHYMYVYPDDETRRIVRKIGQGLGLTWSLAWDGANIWTCTLWNHVYKLSPSGEVLDDFTLGDSSFGTPSQPWGMTFDDQGYMWIVDFAERKVFKIDPVTHVIVNGFDSPYPTQGGCKGLAWDGTYLNVMGWTSPVIHQMTKAGNLVKSIPLAEGGGGGLAWDGEHFWVPGKRILKYDQTGKLRGWIYPASEGTWDMTWDGKYLWASQRTNENWPDAKIFQLEILEDHDHSSYLPVVSRHRTR